MSRHALAIAALFGAGAFIVPACLPALPQVPTLAPTLPTLDVPQAPEVQIPEFTPPEIQAPEGPELPAKPPEAAGNCCIRKGNLLKSECEGAVSCCIEKPEDSGECEKVDGLWFNSKEGCAGAC